MKVQSKEVYIFDGKQYNTVDHAKTEVENRIGSIIDKIPGGQFGPKERLAIYDWLVSNKEDIRKLLSVDFDRSDDPMYSDTINILDY